MVGECKFTYLHKHVNCKTYAEPDDLDFTNPERPPAPAPMPAMMIPRIGNELAFGLRPQIVCVPGSVADPDPFHFRLSDPALKRKKKKYKYKNLIIFFKRKYIKKIVRIRIRFPRNGSEDPDPHQNETDPQHCSLATP